MAGGESGPTTARQYRNVALQRIGACKEKGAATIFLFVLYIHTASDLHVQM